MNGKGDKRRQGEGYSEGWDRIYKKEEDMRPLGKYMFVRRWGVSPSGKTKVWRVQSNRGDELGKVRWYGRWRCYAFFPEPGTVFNASCMMELTDFCDSETKTKRKT